MMDRLRASLACAALMTGASIAWLGLSDTAPNAPSPQSREESAPHPRRFYPGSLVRPLDDVVPVAFEFDPPPPPIVGRSGKSAPIVQDEIEVNIGRSSTRRWEQSDPPADRIPRTNVTNAWNDAYSRQEAPQVRRTPPIEAPSATGDESSASQQNLAPADETEALPSAVDHGASDLPPSQDAEPCRPSDITPTAPKQPLPTLGEVDMDSITRRVETLIQRSFSLSQRGAVFSARAELLHALRLIAQAQDARDRVTRHNDALVSGLRALEEAEDFLPQSGSLETDLGMLIAAHRTPVLKDVEVRGVTAFGAMQQYFAYAQQQIATAGGDAPAASHVLQALGKLQPALSPGERGAASLQTPRAMVFHQAAMMVDPNNHLAANELGVLLARNDQWSDARRVLLHGLSVRPTGETWHNLAVVHHCLGETSLAEKAGRQAQRLAQRGNPSPQSDAVQWVPPEAFVNASGERRSGAAASESPSSERRANVAAASTPGTDAPWWKWWQKLPR